MLADREELLLLSSLPVGSDRLRVTDPTVEARLLSSLSELEELLLELDRELAPPVSPPEPELTSDPPPELES